MAQLFAVEITLTGTAIALTASAALNGAFAKAGRVVITPDPSNSYVATVLVSGVVVKSIAKPSAADAVMDEFALQSASDHNLIELSQISVNGTNGEKVRLLIWVV